MSHESQALAFDELLEQLKKGGGYDFSGYKRASVGRGVDRRMIATRSEDYRGYGAYLDAHPGEYAELFATVLVNVTEFFRDPLAWAALRDGTIPQLLHGARDRPQVRVWSIGCAAGQEPYTIAMVLAEAMGTEAFAERVKIYATDWDEDALSTARRGLYSDALLAGVPPVLRARYFHGEADRLVIDPTLRRAVVFARHNIAVDPPLPSIDLVVFRNTLMYFGAAMQTEVLSRLHRSLAATGFLFLGRSEPLLGESDRFAAHDLVHRVFSKVVPATAAITHAVDPAVRADPRLSSRLELIADNARLRQQRLELTSTNDWLSATVDALGVAVAIVDREGRVRVWNRGAEQLWGLPASGATGRELAALDIGLPAAEVALRLRDVRRTGTRAVLELAARDGRGRPLRCRVSIVPLAGHELGASIVMDPIDGAHGSD